MSFVTHPPTFEIELVHVGESSAETAEHVDRCESCQRRLKALDAAREALMAESPARQFVTRLREKDRASRTRRRRVQVVWGLGLAASLGSASLAYSHMDAAAVQRAQLALNSETSGRHTARERNEPDMVAKGAPRLIVIRQRGNDQEAFQGEVTVRPGDRLRFRLNQETHIVAGILTDAADWVLFVDQQLEAGEHIPEATLEVQGEPASGRVLLGSPSSVALTRAGAPASGIQQAQLHWQSTP